VPAREADTRLITPYGSWTREDHYAVLAPVLLRWKIIRRIVCTAVGILLSGFIFLDCFQCFWCDSSWSLW